MYHLLNDTLPRLKMSRASLSLVETQSIASLQMGILGIFRELLCSFVLFRGLFLISELLVKISEIRGFSF